MREEKIIPFNCVGCSVPRKIADADFMTLHCLVYPYDSHGAMNGLSNDVCHYFVLTFPETFIDSGS